MLAGFGILLMLVYVMMIMLKVFWIELILLWRDIARPYKARNGEWQVLSSLKKKVPNGSLALVSYSLMAVVQIQLSF